MRTHPLNDSDDFMLIDITSLRLPEMLIFRLMSVFLDPSISQVCSNANASLFGTIVGIYLDLFDTTITAGGSKMLKNWFRFPLSHVTLIERRLDLIDNIRCLSKCDFASLCSLLSHIKMPQVLCIW